MYGFEEVPLFLIYAPPYTKTSNGTRILYSLSQLINENTRYKCRIVCAQPPDSSQSVDPRFDVVGKDEVALSESDIVLYPEIITDNPMAARRVVRYLLNRPYYLKNEGIVYGDSDYLLSYSNQISTLAERLFILDDSYAAFEDLRVEKEDKIAVYFGKIDPDNLDKMYDQVRAIALQYKKAECITRFYPEDKEDLRRKIASSRLLLSFDPISNLNYEATLWGTPTLMLNDKLGFLDGSFNMPLYGEFTDYSLLDEAQREVEKALPYYLRFLQEQKSAVRKACDKIVRHFEKYEMDEDYAAVCSFKNHAQAELDRLKYRSEQRETFVSISYPEEIPRKYRKLFGLSMDTVFYYWERGQKRYSLKRFIKAIFIIPLGLDGFYSRSIKPRLFAKK
jgi:hypothetical protein